MLLELGDDPGQQVHRVDVVLLLAQVAGLAQALQVALDALGQQLHMVHVPRGVLGVVREARGLRHVARRALGERAQGHCAFRNGVVVIRQADGEGLEERM